MIKCNLSTFMGKSKVKIADVARDTGLHRNTITLLYKEEANRIDLDAIEKLCRYFNCSICEMFEILDEQTD